MLKNYQSILLACGSRAGSEYIREQATLLGEGLGQRSMTVLYGAGPGLMDTIANAVTSNGGSMKGIIPETFASFATPEQMAISETVDSLFERKQRMLEKSDLTIVLPGAIGTLDEAIETACANDFAKYDNPDVKVQPIIYFNIDGFWEPQRQQLNIMVDKGFLDESVLKMFYFEENAERVLDCLDTLNSPSVYPMQAFQLKP